MAAPRFIALLSGRLRQVLTIATTAGAADAEKVPSTNLDGILDPTLLNATNTSAGAGDADKIAQLDSTGRLDNSMLPVGIGADTAQITASEALAAGDVVNVFDAAGTPNVRKADATAEGKETTGFVLAAVSASATATVYFEGRNTQLSGLTPGARLYMTTTPGVVSATPPAGSGNVVQFVGVAVTATSADFEPGPPVTIA